MNIRYTRKTSGYISLLLGIITLKVFLEALWLGRGPVPGLSFLFYALVFYAHYAENQITRYSVLYYQVLKEIQWNTIIPNIYLKGKNVGGLIDSYLESQSIKPVLVKEGSEISKIRVQIMNSSKNIVEKKNNKIANIKKWGEENTEDLVALFNEYKIMYKESSAELWKNIVLIYGLLIKKWSSFIQQKVEQAYDTS